MSHIEKIKLLIWKNFLLQKRHKWQSFFEILCPVVFSLLLVFTRVIMEPKYHPGITYDAFAPTYLNLSHKYLGNLTDKSLAFSPDSPLTRNVTTGAMESIAKTNIKNNDPLGFFSIFFDSSLLPNAKGYKDAKEMEAALTQPNAMNKYVVGIQFDDSMANATQWPDNITVALRFPAVMRTLMSSAHPLSASWRTNLLFPMFPTPGPREPQDRYGGNTPGYSHEMFLAMQHAVSQEIIKQKTGQTMTTQIYLQRLPQRDYIEDELLIILERFVSIILMISFIYTFVNTVKMVVTEKELQLKETMMIMGLPSWLHWLAWFIKQFSFLLISIIIMTILFKLPLKTTAEGKGFAVFTFTPWSVVLFFLVLFLMSSLTFSFMISAFFSRANTAASFMGLALIFSYSGYMLTQMIYEDISLSTKLLLSLISNTAMGFAFQMMVICESSAKGLQWGNFLEPVSYNDQFVPAHVAFMLILDTILYMLIAMYVEKIRPGLYGVPLPWYFPFTKNFWMPRLDKTNASKKNEVSLEYNDALLKVVHDEEPNGVKPGVNIHKLTKVYKGRKKAVDNLNLRMYENEITVLLGHNGAGKTTTMSMLTGMVTPSSGSATINGYDIVRETEQARQSLGLCPQHNVLFPDLTVGEHVVFYSRLKGVLPSKLAAEVDHFVKLLDLEEKRHVVAAQLSGGQKRRLSVGAAMCGASRVVLLDEPTSGLDPAARRALWDLLQREKRGRTMLLTTHFMDEADVLGDRVAIMAGGRLQCVGTPYFLKKHYGIGYKLTIVKGDQCNVEEVTRFFNTYVPDLKKNSNIGMELSFILPNENVSKFPQMLKDLEERRESLNISSYGLSVTSLEDVFMKAGMENNNEMEENVFEEKTNYTGVYYNGTAANIEDQCDGSMESEEKDEQGIKLFVNRIRAMFLKLFYNTMRSKFVSFIQIIAPIMSLTLSVIVARSWRFVSELPPLPLSLESGFKKTETIISHSSFFDNSTQIKLMTAYKDYFKSSKYPGMTVTDIGPMDLAKFYLKLSSTELSRVRYEALAGATFSSDRMTAWFSNYGYHDSAISLSLANNAVLRSLAPNASLAVTNYPLPYSVENLVTLVSNGGNMVFQFAFNMGFCLGFVASFLVLFIVKERVSGAKLLQRISGVRPAIMWGSALVWDWLWLQIIWLGIICAMACYQQDTMSTPTELGRITLVLEIFSLAAIPLHYVVSFFFDDPPTGFCKMLFINIFSGCIPFLINEIMRLPSVGSEHFADLMDWVFAPLPIYSASRSFRQLSVTSFSMKVCEGLCGHLKLVNCTRLTICHNLKLPVCCLEDDPYMKWEAPGIGRYLLIMTLVGVICFTLLLVKEYELLHTVFYRSKLPIREGSLVLDNDDDVAAERQRVATMTRNEIAQHSLVCKDLSKYYGQLCAVERVSFSVHRGECFGLLGINGAGKTSTFRMVAGDARVTAGDALVLGASVRANVRDVHRRIGYCPQFDALFDKLTARETLRIFCLLRGIPSRVGTVRARRLAAALGFTAHFDKKVHECSGGTRRKLSTAVALLGDAPLVLLDEPTTGMDPASKRRVWAAVSESAARGRSVLLTSHSMEECEALCSRLTVMARGRLHCLGAPQHLKAKFSQGYTLVIKCKAGPQRDDAVTKVGRYVAEQFSEARLVESYLGISTYYVRDAVPWWRVFQVLEAARVQFPIEDYSVSQTTLEQVFLRLTRVQENGEQFDQVVL